MTLWMTGGNSLQYRSVNLYEVYVGVENLEVEDWTVG